MNRRDFVKHSALCAAYLTFGCLESEPGKFPLGLLTGQSGSGLEFFEIPAKHAFSAAVNDEIHSLIKFTFHGKVLYAGFPKRANHFYVWRQGLDKEAEKIDVGGGAVVYGHGFFRPVNGLLYIVAHKKESEDGFLIAWDPGKSAETGRHRSFGPKPHEAMLVNENKVLIANGGKGPNLAVVDLDSGEADYVVKLPSDQYPRHLRRLGENKFLVMPMSAEFMKECQPFILEGKELRRLQVPEFLKEHHRDQILNGFYLEKENAFYTCCPHASGLFKWNAKTEKVEKYLTSFHIKGLALLPGGEGFVANSSDGKILYRIDPGSLSVSYYARFERPMFEIAHMSLFT